MKHPTAIKTFEERLTRVALDEGKNNHERASTRSAAATTSTARAQEWGGWPDATSRQVILKEASERIAGLPADARGRMFEPHTPKKHGQIVKCRCKPNEVEGIASPCRRR